MIDTIFRKMLLTYLAVTLLTILAISTVIGYFMQRDVYDRSTKLLDQKAAQVQRLIGLQQAGRLAPGEYAKELRTIERNNANLHISIIGKGVRKFQGDTLPYGSAPGLAGWVREVLDGRSLTVKSPFQSTDQVMLIVGQPVYKNGRVVGGLFLYTPLRDIKGTIRLINRYILLASILILVPAIGVIFLVSRHFAGPIAKLDETAAKLAAGDFNQTLNVRGQDEIARLARSFQTLAGKLERIEQGRRRFISELSHELRTPITSIRGSLQGLMDGIVEPGEEREFLRISLQETVRLGKMVEDLLDLAAFEERKAELRIAETDLAALVREAAMQLQIRAQELRIRLACRAADPIPARVDRDRVRQVVLNLLDNALRHTPEGGEVEVDLAVHSPPEGADAFIRVRDTGIGIEPDKLPHVFDRFYKADTSRSSQGAGLGLTIARQIAEAHGGGIQVFSEPGRGTEFIVRLPLAGTGGTTNL